MHFIKDITKFKGVLFMPPKKSHMSDVLQSNGTSDKKVKETSTIPNRDLMRNHYTKDCNSLKRVSNNIERKVDTISYSQDRLYNVETEKPEADARPFASNQEPDLPELQNQPELKTSSTDKSHKRDRSSDSIENYEYKAREEFYSRTQSLNLENVYKSVYGPNWTLEQDPLNKTTTDNQRTASTDEASTQNKEVSESNFPATPMPELNLSTPEVPLPRYGSNEEDDRSVSTSDLLNEEALISCKQTVEDSQKEPLGDETFEEVKTSHDIKRNSSEEDRKTKKEILEREHKKLQQLSREYCHKLIKIGQKQAKVNIDKKHFAEFYNLELDNPAKSTRDQHQYLLNTVLPGIESQVNRTRLQSYVDTCQELKSHQDEISQAPESVSLHEKLNRFNQNLEEFRRLYPMPSIEVQPILSSNELIERARSLEEKSWELQSSDSYRGYCKTAENIAIDQAGGQKILDTCTSFLHDHGLNLHYSLSYESMHEEMKNKQPGANAYNKQWDKVWDGIEQIRSAQLIMQQLNGFFPDLGNKLESHNRELEDFRKAYEYPEEQFPPVKLFDKLREEAYQRASRPIRGITT